MLDKAISDIPDAAFMVNLGDHVGTGVTQSQWDGYFKATRGLCESLPHMSASGNHENYYPSGELVDELTLGRLFSLQFNNPDNGRNALANLTVDSVSKDHNKGLITNVEDTIYSFDYGNTHNSSCQQKAKCFPVCFWLCKLFVILSNTHDDSF